MTFLDELMLIMKNLNEDYTENSLPFSFLCNKKMRLCDKCKIIYPFRVCPMCEATEMIQSLEDRLSEAKSELETFRLLK